jgi:O-acetyl-ADP-ribose deacetylase (regulator of RNase III)
MFAETDAYQEYLDQSKTHSSELKELNMNDFKKLILHGWNETLKTKHSHKIQILYSDLGDFSDECLVNAANELLLGGGGIDGFVHDLGGQKLLDEIKQIPLNEYDCRLLEGEAVYTNGYNDKYTSFIHTVAPYYDEAGNLKSNVMERCFDSIFDIVREKSIKTITIPAIGTGFYGFYMLDFTRICFKKILQHLELNPQLEKITLITNYKLQYNFYHLALNSIHHE